MASLTTRIEFDTNAFLQEAQTYVDRVVAPAIVDTINMATAAAKAALIEALPVYLDKPMPFTMGAIGALPATRDVDTPSGYVCVKSQQAQYLQYEILGGTRGPGDYATTEEGPLIPGPDAELDVYGNLPDGYISQQEALGAAWVTLKPGEPPALVRSINGRTEIYALVVYELHYEAGRFPFYDVVANAVERAMPGAWGKALKARGGA